MAATAGAASHCIAGERTLWSCSAKGKVYELCASADLSKDSGYIQYRAGRLGRIEFIFPEERRHPRGRFRFRPYARDAGLQFINGQYEYELFDQLIGVSEIRIWRKDGKFLSTISCGSSNEILTDTATFNLFKRVGIDE